jgi:hypothetical protein
MRWINLGTNHKLVDAMREMVGAKNDAELSRILKIGAPEISRINHGKKLGASILVKLHRHTLMPIAEIESRLGLE